MKRCNFYQSLLLSSRFGESDQDSNYEVLTAAQAPEAEFKLHKKRRRHKRDKAELRSQNQLQGAIGHNVVSPGATPTESLRRPPYCSTTSGPAPLRNIVASNSLALVTLWCLMRPTGFTDTPN